MKNFVFIDSFYYHCCVFYDLCSGLDNGLHLEVCDSFMMLLKIKMEKSIYF